MSDIKKYYYLKLKENFFDTDEMILLESMKDGFVYQNILMKLYLRSLKNDGKLMLNERIPYNSSMLASVTRQSVGDVEKAMKIFIELGLIEVLDNGTIYLLDIQNYIGHSSTEADRVRAYRSKISDEKALLCNSDVTNVVQMYDKSTPEIKIELKKEKELNNMPKTPRNVSNFKEVFEHYMTLDLINHRSYTKDMQRAIETALKNNHYDIDYCKTLLDRHKAVVEITKHTEFPVKARSLYEFFGQKVFGCKNLICTEYEEGGKLYEKHLKDSKPKVDISEFEVIYQDG